MSFIPNYSDTNPKTRNIKNIIGNDNYSLKAGIEKLKNDILKLSNENNSLKNENQRLKNEIKIKNDNLIKFKFKIDELNIDLTKKNNEIINLNNEMKNLKLNNNINNEYIRRGEMLSIQIKSIDQKVDISYPCKNTDIFVRIEEMLYNEYPEFKDLNTYFYC